MPRSPNAADLTTVAQVQEQQLDIASGDLDLVQALITALSRHILFRTSRRILNGVGSYTDLYDGSGGDKQFVKDYPIISVSAVLVWNVAVPASSDGVSAGYIFDDYSVILLPGTTMGTPAFWAAPGRWPKGRRNISISYQAGFNSNTNPPSDSTFAGAPTELGQAVTEYVVQQLKRRDWVDQASKIIAAGETITMRSWEMPPWLERVIEHYKRMVLP